jgi:hypothetical protein
MSQQRLEELSESPWASQAKEHWKKHRPKLYAVERTKDQYYRAIEDGMEPHEAWEAVRENYLFLPSEEDQPSLGEDPNPKPESTLAAEIPAPRQCAAQEEVKHFLARGGVYSPCRRKNSGDMPSPSKLIH